MIVIVVEGESDRAAVETLGARLGLAMPPVVAVGGSKGARRAAQDLAGARLLGLVDAAERRDFERVLDAVFVCEPDLEGEFVRALGIHGVESLIAQQGELESFRRLQQQPAQRERTPEQQLARFFGGRSGNKRRYAELLASALPLERIPPPIAQLLSAF
ncbi:ATP-dependent endonuclease [Microbacterium sp. DT81.1]|uniref:hypothetical protein n=1 Tax=Microbacterium sp. DT81.1 TaxID=3393413 RepID=UPI003CF076E1